MIQKFKTTEKSVRIVEADNTLVIEVGLKDSKDEIKKEVEKMFNVKVMNVRTHIKANKKIAYIRLDKKNPAIDVATKFGVI
jgi:large subunit ribosomal protein L23